MKYIVIGLLIFIFLLIILCYFFRKKWAIKKVRCTTDEEKLFYINKALAPFGFEFDMYQDVVISKNDAWQRNLGYMDFYDSKAPFLNMVMDCQPIYFDYDNKHYRIEFWKGQYGLTTGAEIGIYIRDNQFSILKEFYRAANDDERLDMTFSLSKKCKLFSRYGTSWWLTGFDVGLFSKPKDLQMKICIQFLDCKMRNAFVKALIKAGYTMNNIEICNNSVCFEFCCPSYYKPNCTHRIIKFIAQIFNYINCHIYMYFTRFFNRTIDKLTYLRYMAPCLYRFVIRLCVPRRKRKRYHKR